MPNSPPRSPPSSPITAPPNFSGSEIPSTRSPAAPPPKPFSPPVPSRSPSSPGTTTPAGPHRPRARSTSRRSFSPRRYRTGAPTRCTGNHRPPPSRLPAQRRSRHPPQTPRARRRPSPPHFTRLLPLGRRHPVERPPPPPRNALGRHAQTRLRATADSFPVFPPIRLTSPIGIPPDPVRRPFSFL